MVATEIAIRSVQNVVDGRECSAASAETFEKLAPATGTALSVVGPGVINALRVAGVMQVQLDVCVARVSRSEFRALNFDFLTNSKNALPASWVITTHFFDVESGALTFDTHLGALSDIRASRDGQRFWMRNKKGEWKMVEDHPQTRAVFLLRFP